MTRRQQSKLNMYDTVITYCTANAAAISAMPAFQTVFTTFQAPVQQIHDTSQLQATVINGIAIDKSKRRLALCKQATKLSAIIFAFASGADNNQLKEQGNFAFSDFNRFNDEMLVPTCANIRDAINANITALASYGVTAATVTGFQTAIDAYSTKITTPRNAVSQRAAHGTTLANLFQQADDILKNQLDKVALQFETTSESFYSAYKNNRAIVSPGASATQIEGTITNSVTHDPLPGATVQVVGQPLTAVTNENGFFVLRSVSPGSHSVTVASAGYGDKQQNDLLVKLGKTTNADIAITPKVS